MNAPSIESRPDISVDGVIRVPRGVTVQDFADRLGRPAADLIRILMQMGEMLTATQSMSATSSSPSRAGRTTSPIVTRTCGRARRW